MIDRLRRAVAVVPLLVAATGLVVVPAGSASAAPTKCAATSLKQDAIAADAVFRGVVKKQGRVHGSDAKAQRAYRISTDRIYQGSLLTGSPVVMVRTHPRGCTLLGGTLTTGTRYIFFVSEKGGQFVADRATARATTSLTRTVVALLGSGKRPELNPPADAEFTRVADATPPRLTRLLAPGGALVIVSLLGLAVVGRLGRRTA